MIVCTELGDGIVDIDDEEGEDEVGIAMQMASPAEELVLSIEVGILLEVVVEEVVVEVEGKVVLGEVDSRSEHHGKDVVEEEVPGAA